MQCASCRFENMPGVEHCGRCGSVLRLAAAAIDVHPPRARPWAKRLRRVFPLGPVFAGARNTVTSARDHVTVAAGGVRIPVPERPALLRLLVPGWAHFYWGQTLRGRVFLGLYLALLLPALLFVGTTSGNLLLGFAFSVHASAAMDILFQYPQDFPSRFGTAVVVNLALFLALYLPVGWLVTRFASTQAITADAAPFAEGDVVLVNQWSYLRSAPRPGDVVLYDTPDFSLTAAAGEHAAIRVQPGQAIDRVLAGPGSVVRWDSGQLSVDDLPSPWQPLNPRGLRRHLEVQVPEGSYLILPSTLVVRVHGNAGAVPDSLVESLSVVPAERIRGRVYLRSHPLNHLWFVR